MDDFLANYNQASADNITMAAAQASDDVVEIKKAEVDAIISEAARAAREQGVLLDKEVADFRAKKTAEVNILEDLASKKRSIEEKYTHQRAMKDYAIGMIGNPRQRDFAGVEEEFRRRRENLDRDASIPNSTQGNEEWAQKRMNLELEYQAALKQTRFEHRNAFDRMVDDMMTYDQVVGEIQANFVDGFLNGLNEFVRTGEFSLSDFTTNMLLMMEQLIAKQLMLLAIEQMIGKTRRETSQIDIGGGSDGGIMGWLGLASSAAGAFGGAFNSGGGFNGTGPLQSFQTGAGYSALSSIGSFFEFADGGVVKMFANGGISNKELNDLPMASKAEMDSGGVKKSAHMAIFAEAGVPEAFIPMTDGENIPLSVSKDSAGNITASALLPDGRSIPAKVIDGNISAFALGGTTNGVEDSMSDFSFDPPTMSVLPDMTSAIDSFIDAISDASSRIDSMLGGYMAGAGSTNISAPNVTNKNGGDNIAMTFNVQDGKSSSDKSGSGDSGKTDQWSKIADRVKDMIVTEITMQKRPGGLLWESGKT
jgi:hypothetical protein